MTKYAVKAKTRKLRDPKAIAQTVVILPSLLLACVAAWWLNNVGNRGALKVAYVEMAAGA